MPRGWPGSCHASLLALRTIGTPTASPRVGPARGDAQHPAHRGHPMTGLVRLHEPEDLPGTEPVSRANQTAAFFRISRSLRSWRLSRRSRRSSSSSELVRPSSRRPSSRSAWRTQLRIAEAEHSTPGSAPRAYGPSEPAQPSGAGIPARRVNEFSASEHLLRTV